MKQTCNATPLSFWLLERHLLGELQAARRAQVDAHLRDCPACRQRLQGIQSDVRPMPPLPDEAGRRPAWPLTLAAAAAASLAVLFFLVWLTSGPGRQPGFPPPKTAVKGGELSVVLIRERDGVTGENPTRFAPGDRFKLLMTCPGGDWTDWQVVVFQAGEVFFPIASRAPVPCGNRVPLPGAFGLSGDAPVAVCLMVGERIPAREELTRRGAQALPEETVCAPLEAVAPE